MKISHLISFAALSISTLNGMAQIADAGPDQAICGDTTDLQGNAPGGGQTGQWTVFSGSAVFADPTDPLTQATALTFGDNDLVWTLTDGITTTTDTVLVTAFDPAAPPSSAGPDQTIIAPPYTGYLDASGYTYPCNCSWSVVVGASIIAMPTDPLTAVAGLSPGANIFRWTCVNGPCGTTSDDVVLNLLLWTGLSEGVHAPPSIQFDMSSGSVLIASGRPVDELHILDINGREVQARELTEGVYIAQVRMDDEVFTQRFVVQR